MEAIGRIKLPSDEIGKTLGGTGLAGELGFSHLKVWNAYFEANYRGRMDSWMNVEFREEVWSRDKI